MKAAHTIPPLRRILRLDAARIAPALLTLTLCGSHGAATAQAATESSGGTGAAQGPIRLRSSSAAPASAPDRSDRADRANRAERPESAVLDAPEVEPAGEFEGYLARLGHPNIRRFGQELVTGRAQYDAAETSAVVPADYVVGPGDELLINLWGSVDADLRAVVDRSGRVVIPRVGPVMVSGTRFAELPEVISKRVSQTFRNFQLSVSLGQVRSLRIYVTGYVRRPGTYTVSALSSVVSSLMRSGGPSAAGSLRNIELRRGNETVSRYDLYALLLKGDRSADRVVQSGDVIHVGPVGPQVALVGSVHRPAIFELRKGETLSDLIAMGGGFSSVADRDRVTIERIEDRPGARVREFALRDVEPPVPADGDIVRVFSAVEATQSVAKQNKRVRLDGEFLRPGDYVLPAGATLREALALAGGLTPFAYVYGTEFSRESVRANQQANYDRALRDLEVDLTRHSSSQRAVSADEAAAFEQRNASSARLLDRLRQVKPTGRIVLNVTPDSRQLPDLAMEDGDRVLVPARPTTVGVFGSVFNSGAFLYDSARNLGDYVTLAGGPTKGADAGSTFVIRPDGSVMSQLQNASFFGLVGGLQGVPAQPGDTLFVPEQMNRTTWTQDLKEWTQILYQFGLGAAALKTLKN